MVRWVVYLVSVEAMVLARRLFPEGEVALSEFFKRAGRMGIPKVEAEALLVSWKNQRLVFFPTSPHSSREKVIRLTE